MAKNAHASWAPADDHGAQQADRVTALLEALDGVDLGAHDRYPVFWLVEREVSVVGTVVSWLYRARAAGTEVGDSR
jgi:hypothetical protein